MNYLRSADMGVDFAQNVHCEVCVQLLVSLVVDGQNTFRIKLFLVIRQTLQWCTGCAVD